MRLGVGTLVFALAFGSWLACLHHAPTGGAGRVLRVLDHTGRGTTPLPLPLAGREAAPPPFDLDSPSGLRATLTLVASRGGWSSERPGIADIVLLTSDRRGVRLAANTALQLRRFGIAHTLVLMGAEADCGHAQAEYMWLAAGWSSGLRGFGRYKGTGFSQSDVDLWALWSAKWLVLARLVELRASVLALDTDMLVLADPYPLLRVRRRDETDTRAEPDRAAGRRTPHRACMPRLRRRRCPAAPSSSPRRAPASTSASCTFAAAAGPA